MPFIHVPSLSHILIPMTFIHIQTYAIQTIANMIHTLAHMYHHSHTYSYICHSYMYHHHSHTYSYLCHSYIFIHMPWLCPHTYTMTLPTCICHHSPNCTTATITTCNQADMERQFLRSSLSSVYYDDPMFMTHT